MNLWNPPPGKEKEKKMSFHSSIFIFRGWMLIRERRKQRGVRNGIKSGGGKRVGERRREEEERDERGGARWSGGVVAGSSVGLEER